MFQIKFEVQALEAELTALNNDIREREEAIRVLRAEWSYLNEPNRLATLAARYLELTPVAASQLVRFDDVPLRPAPGTATAGRCLAGATTAPRRCHAGRL